MFESFNIPLFLKTVRRLTVRPGLFVGEKESITDERGVVVRRSYR